AIIAGFFGWWNQRRTHAHEFDKARFARQQQLLEQAALAVSEVHAATIDLFGSHRILLQFGHARGINQERVQEGVNRLAVPLKNLHGEECKLRAVRLNECARQVISYRLCVTELLKPG